ncbi:MAG TPA: NlpC/P60 family protein [Candidatus Acidoferrum sp.]|nr:NlpC/P60 family protein [Candidatus Acidoferrum sp.]
MGRKWNELDWCAVRGFMEGLGRVSLAATVFFAIAAAPARAQVSSAEHSSTPKLRLLSLAEGRSILDVAWQAEQQGSEMRDCSHVVHQIYRDAGFEYPYASSYQIYAGDRNFARVKHPHAGDIVAWRGHVGIVVDPQRHSFYSLVRTGLEEQSYEAPYWKSRGTPRFYRFVLATDAGVKMAKARVPGTASNGRVSGMAGTVVDAKQESVVAAPKRSEEAVSAESKSEDDAAVPSEAAATENAEPHLAIPTGIVVMRRDEEPSDQDVAEGIAKLNDAMGAIFRNGAAFDGQLPIEIVENFRVEKVRVKQDSGWANVNIESRVQIEGQATRVKHRHEKIRWELRRTNSGWEALAPAERVFVARDVAIKYLATNLAKLANGDGATQHNPDVVQREAQLASLLNSLLETKPN